MVPVEAQQEYENQANSMNALPFLRRWEWGASLWQSTVIVGF
jgi:hypothetical protein